MLASIFAPHTPTHTQAHLRAHIWRHNKKSAASQNELCALQNSAYWSASLTACALFSRVEWHTRKVSPTAQQRCLTAEQQKKGKVCHWSRAMPTHSSSSGKPLSHTTMARAAPLPCVTCRNAARVSRSQWHQIKHAAHYSWYCWSEWRRERESALRQNLYWTQLKWRLLCGLKETMWKRAWEREERAWFRLQTNGNK